MKTTFRVGAAIAATMLVLGCKETTSSEFIRTGGIAALIDIEAEDETSSKVHVELRVGGDESNTYVVLEGGDKLTAKAGSETKDLQSVADGVYEGHFATGKEVEFVIGLDRVEDEDAPSSKGTLPPPFDVTAPEADAVHSRADEDFVVTWSPVPNAEATVEINGSCIFSETYTASGELGTLVIHKGDLKNTNDEKPESCVATVTVKCQRQGTADTAFDDESHVYLFRSQSTTFTSDP